MTGREVAALELRSLFHLPHELLAELLKEESRAWAEHLRWDFTPAAELVQHYVSMRSLNGIALLDKGEVAGYSYYVTEFHKGLIGDLYIRDRSRSEEAVTLLMNATLDDLLRSPYVRRVEAQLMLLGDSFCEAASACRSPQIHPRLFMVAPLDRKFRERKVPEVRFENWTHRWMAPAAALIEATYYRHIDAEINDQYRDSLGAERFLHNIIQYPGCGQFMPSASWVALDNGTGEVVALSLASAVSSETGHITQICVAPGWQGKGVGYEALRRSLAVMSAGGYREVTLTVTEANQQAIALYERMGFRTGRRFHAYVWDAPLLVA